jgi:hypothetical protein
VCPATLESSDAERTHYLQPPGREVPLLVQSDTSAGLGPTRQNVATGHPMSNRVVHIKRVAVIAAIAAMIAGCGGGDNSGAETNYTQDEVAQALRFYREHHETMYERAPGKKCVVARVLTSRDEIQSAQSVADEVPTALAVSDDGGVAVMFSGFGTFNQDECIASAETDLNALGG